MIVIKEEFLGRGETINEPQVVMSSFLYPSIGIVLC